MSTALEPILDDIRRYQDLTSAKAAIEEELKTLRGRIEDALGDDDTGTILGVPVVTWKFGKRRSLDQRALRAAHPELVEEFTTLSETRTFKVVQ